MQVGPLGSVVLELLWITGGSLAVTASPSWAQAVCLASDLALCPWLRIHQQGVGCELGQEPLALLIGFLTFCSGVWIAGCSSSGSWQPARG